MFNMLERVTVQGHHLSFSKLCSPGAPPPSVHGWRLLMNMITTRYIVATMDNVSQSVSQSVLSDRIMVLSVIVKMPFPPAAKRTRTFCSLTVVDMGDLYY